MLKKIFMISAASLFLFAASASLSAQNRTVSGKVTDAAGQPLWGGVVLLEGTTDGVATEDDGAYSIKVPPGEVVLHFTCLGFKDKNVRVPSSQTVLDVSLEEDNMLLEETVVVGYGVQKKVNLTGAISTVGEKSLENRSAHNLGTMLQGAVPGLNISTSSGNPGSEAKLNIRGVTSINETEPIVIIDGAVGDISRVNSNDVESISVIKDAAAAAVYGARGAYGVILITTKSGSAKDGKATVSYSGRFGWEEPTTSTDYETRGYWSVYTVDKFWQADSGNKYTTYTDADMAQLLARVNDKTEDPSRPWVVEQFRNGRKQWVYYCNTDWYHELYNDRHPVQNHSISVRGGNDAVKYYVSANYDRQSGIIKTNPDVFQKVNLRSKLDFKINKYIRMSNNTSYYLSDYSWVGAGSVQDSFYYASRHALASFPLKNPDGSWVYGTPMISGNYNVANGRHIIFADGYDRNVNRKSDFSNTTQIVITPVRQLNITGNFTYRQYQDRNTERLHEFSWRRYPDAELESYTTGAGKNKLTEEINTYNYLSGNVYATFEETWASAHHFTAMAGMNVETWHRKDVSAVGENLLSDTLNDLSLIGTDSAGGATITSVGGGQKSYALLGFFGRLNYDYKGRYLFEVSGRYDGTSRFAAGSRWGFFPSASAGWRISEEPFFAPAKKYVDNLKLRVSYGSLGNQNVGYYDYLRLVKIENYEYSFGEGSSLPKKASLTAPVAGDLTWETSQQYNLGLDVSMLKNRLEFTAEAYIRDTKNMLTDGIDLPSVFGGTVPKMNTADLRTYGYELQLGWRDEFKLFGLPFGYGIRGSLSDFRSYITRYANIEKTFAKDYYEGQRLGEIWGFVVDGLFQSDEEAAYYDANVCNMSDYIGTSRMRGGWQAGDLRYVDLDGDGKLGIGQNTVDNPGDRKILGNSLASLQYGFNLSLDYAGVDISAFFQGTGNHYWYPAKMNMVFWGPYAYSYTSFLEKDFLKKCWSEDNRDAYFPRPRAYSSTGGQLKLTNSRYLQNLRYLRFKNLTVGYTLPKKWTEALHIQKVRFYFTGENLCYWSPLKKVTKYLDPESAYTRKTTENSPNDAMAYPWQKTFMFGVDITF